MQDNGKADHDSRHLIIRYDPLSQQRKLLRLLENFLQAFGDDKLRAAVGGDWLNQLRDQSDEVKDRLRKEFQLVVLGDFKRGKSTLINALVEAEVASTDVTPETVTINRLRYGPKHRANAHLPDGGRVALDVEDLQADRLTGLLERLPDKPEFIQIEAPAEWLRGIQLVDTPGMGDLLWRFDEQVQSYLPGADAVIYVISAISPLSESERVFLQFSLRPQEFSKVNFVVNMMDSMKTPADANRVLSSIQGKLGHLFPGAPVFGVSALDEYCRQHDEVRPRSERREELEAEFSRLRDHLQESVLLNRDVIQLERAMAMADGMLEGSLKSLTRLSGALDTDVEQLAEAIDECEDQDSALHRRISDHKHRVRESILALGAESSRWMRGFVDRFQADAAKQLEEFPHDIVQRHFPFFLAETMRDSMTACVDAHQSQIMDAMMVDEGLSGEITGGVKGAAAFKEMDAAVGRVGFSPASWTFLDNFHALFMFFGIGGVVGHLITGTLDKTMANKDRATDYRTHVYKAFPELKQATIEEVERLYKIIAEKVDQHLDAVYRGEIEHSLTTLKQARELRSTGEQDLSVVSRELERAVQHIEQTRDELQSLQDAMEKAQEGVFID